MCHDYYIQACIRQPGIRLYTSWSQVESPARPLVISDLSLPGDIPSTTMTDFRIIGTIATLDQISLRNQSSRCLVPLVARMFRFLGDRLASAISSPASQSSLEQLVSFFPVLLTRSLSLLPVDAPLSDIVEVFVQLPYDCVILPIVRSFGQIGRQRLSAMLESGDQSQDLLPLDIRPTLFGICKSLVLCLSTRPRLQTSLSLLLAFSSSQQLEIELSGQKECSIGSDYWLQRSPLRDSFWYLSALLRVAFLKGLAPQENDSESIDPLTPIEQVAKEAIISRLGTILHEDKWPPKLTTVERNVLIALVEIAYNTGWINLSG